MIIKWIKCSAKEEKKAAFSSAQEQWKGLLKMDGFLGQAGGWSKSGYDAEILAFWKDISSYEAFMKKNHDEIFNSIGQKGTYENIEVTVYEGEDLTKEKLVLAITSSVFINVQKWLENEKNDENINEKPLKEDRKTIVNGHNRQDNSQKIRIEFSQGDKETASLAWKIEPAWRIV